MDKNNLLNILKTLTELMHCPTCGEAYTIEEVQYISQVESYCLLQVNCKKCNLPIWVNFFVEKETKKKVYRNAKVLNHTDISANEIIEFHQNISKFNGDFKKIFIK